MKNLFWILFSTVIVMLISSPARADNPAEKFNKGLVEIITSPLEIAKQIDQSWKESAKDSEPATKGVFTGFFKGVGNSIGKLGSGIWNIATFPLSSKKPTPDDSKISQEPPAKPKANPPTPESAPQ